MKTRILYEWVETSTATLHSKVGGIGGRGGIKMASATALSGSFPDCPNRVREGGKLLLK